MKSKFLKIIYFDEAFVADFLQIIAGGELKRTTEFMTEVEGGAKADINADASVGTEKKGLPKLFSMLSGANLNVEVEGSADISHKRERVARNILENTLLADFLSILESDVRKKKNKRCKGIEMFSNLTVHPEKDSFSYLMLVAPYLSMIDGQLQIEDNKSLKIDLAKVEQAINKGRGFYEFIGNVEGRKTIFRFNYTAFRNSYTMSDLPKMRLTYYAIKVGEITPEELKVEKEFEFGTIQRKRVDYTDSNDTSQKTMAVYDVVLAGVEQN